MEGPSRTSFHLAVLECDTPIDAVKNECGTYGDIFRKLLVTNSDDGWGKTSVQVSKWDVVTAQEYPDLDNVDGLLLTGSKHNCFEDHPWILKLVEYTKKALDEKQMPIVGICFGHQIIARAVGMRTGRNDDGWEISAESFELTDVGSKLLGGRKSLTLHQMHRDIVFDVPEGFYNLGSSPRCKVQGLYLPKRVLSVQAHPEFNKFIMSEILRTRYEQKIFDQELYNDGLSRAGLHHDGQLFANVAVKFLVNPSSINPIETKA